MTNRTIALCSLLLAGSSTVSCTDADPWSDPEGSELRSLDDASLILHLPFDLAGDVGAAEAGHGCSPTNLDVVVDSGRLAADFGNDAGCIALDVNGAAADGASAVTLAAWVRPRAHEHAVLYRQHNGTLAGYQLELKAGKLSVGGRSRASDSYQQLTLDTAMELDVWHHVAGVLDYANDRLELYIDGVLAGSLDNLQFSSSSFELDPASAPDMLGFYAPGNNYHYDGGLDDLRVYDRGLSLAELTTLVETTRAGLPAPVVNLEFEDPDALGLNLGTGEDCAATGLATRPRRVQSGALFDGQHTRCVFPDAVGQSMANIGGATISAWINPAEITRGKVYRQSFEGLSAAYQLGFEQGWLVLTARSRVNEPPRQARVPWTHAPNSGWHHVVGVVDYQGTQMLIYIDGVLAQRVDVAFDHPTLELGPDTPGPLVGVRTLGADQHFAGELDQLRVYPYAVQATGAEALFIPSVYRLEFEDPSQPGAGLDGAPVCDPSGGIAADVNQAGDRSRTNFSPYLDGVADVSLHDDCRIEDSYLDQLADAPAVSLAAWVRPNDSAEVQTVMRTQDLFDGLTTYDMRLVPDGDGSMTLQARARSRRADALQIASVAWPESSAPTWHHVVAVLDYQHDRISIYIDGELQANQSASFGVAALAPWTLSGWIGYSDRAFSGALDDVRLYAQRLDADQALQVYQGTAIETAAWLQFEDLSAIGRGLRMSGRRPSDNCAPTVFGQLDGVVGLAADFESDASKCVFAPAGDEVTASSVVAGASGLTLAAWIRPQTDAGTHLIYELDHAGPTKRLEFGLRDGQGLVGAALELEIRDPVNNDNVVVSTPWIWGEANWHHVAGVVDLEAGVLELYVDGSLYASVAHDFGHDTFAPLAFNDADTIAGSRTQLHGLRGSIDEFRMIRGALDPARIMALVRAPVFRMSFEDPATLGQPDAGSLGSCTGLGGPNASVTRDPAPASQSGAVELSASQACTFSDNRHARLVNGTRRLTLAAFARPDELEGSQRIYRQNFADGWLAYGLRLDADMLRFELRQAPGGPLHSVVAPWPGEPGEWHHVTAQVDLGEDRITLLVDGHPVASGSGYDDAPLMLEPNAHQDQVGVGFEGALDDVRLYTSLWSPADDASTTWADDTLAHFYAPAIASTIPHELDLAVADELSQVLGHCSDFEFDTESRHRQGEGQHQNVLLTQPFSGDGSVHGFITHSGDDGEILHSRFGPEVVGGSGEILGSRPPLHDLILDNEDHPDQPDWIPAPNDASGGVLIVPFESERRVVVFTLEQGDADPQYVGDLAIPNGLEPTNVFVDHKDGYTWLVVADRNNDHFVPYRARPWELFDLEGDWTNIDLGAFEHAGEGPATLHQPASADTFDEAVFTVTDGNGEWFLLRYVSQNGNVGIDSFVRAYPLTLDPQQGLVIGPQVHQANLWQAQGHFEPNCSAGCSHRVGPDGKLVVAGIGRYADDIFSFNYMTEASTCRR